MADEYWVLKLKAPAAKGTPGVCDMLCKPIQDDAPAGRRVRMQTAAALDAVYSGKAEMLSPGGKTLLANTPRPKKGAVYKTRVQKAEIDALS